MNDPLLVLRPSSYWVHVLDFIKIDHGAISEFAQTISPSDLPSDPGVRFFYDGWTTEEKIALLLIFNSINFSFWPDHGQNRWTVQDQNGKTLDGSTAASWCLETAAKTGFFDPLNFTFFEHISEEDLAAIFHHEKVENEIPMLRERAVCLNELGQRLRIQNCGDIRSLLGSWNRNAVNAVQYLINSVPNFNDVPFFKRAQLAVSMIHRVLLKERPHEAFEDIGALTAFADYRLPQVLRGMGVLVYWEGFADVVDREMEIAPGTLMEFCIRGATVWAAEYLRQELENRWELPVTAAQVDTFLWYKARELKDSLGPHHRTRTTAY